MSDFYEIDFLNINSSKSGDAIPMRYSKDGITRIHVTDGGYQSTGETLVNFIKTNYDNPTRIDAVIVTHPDGDHAGGLRSLFDEFDIDVLWMNRPWLYADELLPRFSRFTNVENLKKRLKELYPNIAALEELALSNNVPIHDPLQGAVIGHFHVLAPSKSRYLDLIVDSDKTPEATKIAGNESFVGIAKGLFQGAIEFIKSSWGEESFPTDDTSAENNMSVVQYAYLCDKRILLTGDAGRATLNEAADHAPYVGLELPGIDNFQIPHHGSRHNVSSELLDRWLGPIKGSHEQTFTAIVSASEQDEHHPRKSVLRAVMHRGARVVTCQKDHLSCFQNAKSREGWTSAVPVDYPQEQEA